MSKYFKKNKKLLESRIGLGGINSSGPHSNRSVSKYPSGYNMGGFSGDPDSLYSQRQSLASTLEENEEQEEEEKDDQMSEKENLYEFFTRIAKLSLHENKNVEEGQCSIEEGHCSTHESSCTMSEKHCDEALRIMEESELEEASGVAALGGGPATPLGTDAKGKVPSKRERKNRLKHAKKTYGGK